VENGRGFSVTAKPRTGIRGASVKPDRDVQPPEKREEFLKQLAETMSVSLRLPDRTVQRGSAVGFGFSPILAEPDEGDADSELSRSQASPATSRNFHTLLKPGPEGLMASGSRIRFRYAKVHDFQPP
jgi:hypothetical protein